MILDMGVGKNLASLTFWSMDMGQEEGQGLTGSEEDP